MALNSSIDNNEVKKFSTLASKWWDLKDEFKILHQITPLRLEYIKDTIVKHFKIESNDQPFKDLSVLDVGCGGGLVTIPVHLLGANVTAIDASVENIEAASKKAYAEGLEINYLHSTAEELSKENSRYDVILCLEVIEHVASPKDFVKNIASLIKPGGMLIVSTINRNIKSYFLGICMAEYILNWVPKGTHDYHKFLKPSELNNMLNGTDLVLKELKGLFFNVLKQEWQLSTNIDVNYFAYITRA